MALSDLAIFTDYAYDTMTEVLAQNVQLFNGASNGMLVLGVGGFGGDFSDRSFWSQIDGLVRRRNPYGDGPIAEKVLAQKIDTIVKVAAGTPPIRMDPAWMQWIARSPEEPAIAMGKQLAVLVLADMLNVAIGCVTAAILKTPALINDISGNTGPAALPSPIALANTTIKLGDVSSEIRGYIMHSKTWNDLYGNALTNNERLFDYGSVNVSSDPTGRRYIMNDNPALIDASSGKSKFHTLALTTGAVNIEQNPDFNDNWSDTNGNENIKRTYQAEWSYNVGVKGFSYDKTSGHAPSDAALFNAASWDQTTTSIKNGPGAILVSQ